VAAATSINLDEHLAPAGRAAQSFARLWDKLWQEGPLGAELLDLCRLTFARLHADPLETAALNPHLPRSGALESRRRAVLGGTAHTDPAFAGRERAVLEFAELYWLDARSITDEAADAVKAHYGEPGLVYLVEALGLLDGRIRTARCLRDLSAHPAS
jgi:hypothetical protein